MERVVMDPQLAAARGRRGERIFYPPGQHPATARLREQLAKIEELGGADGQEWNYLRDQLAAFEEGESLAKADWLRYGRS